MSVKKIIPCLDINKGRVVKGVNFINLVDAGDPVEIAKAYDLAGADEIVFLDISATVEGRNTAVEMLRRASEQVTVPLTIGGGIGCLDDFQRLFDVGAQKVGVNSAAVRNPQLLADAAEKFGSQRVVAAVDVKKQAEGIWTVCINGGKTDTGMDAMAWMRTVQHMGAGEILLTSMDRDGTKSGYDIELHKAAAQAVSIPITASGGAGCMQDFADVLTEGKASAALAASLFHFGEVKIPELKQYLTERGIEVERNK